MSFYEFRFEKFHALHKRGNIPDSDLVTFTIMINRIDRGHGSALFNVVVTDSVQSTDDRSADTPMYLAYPAKNPLHIDQDWTTGPFETSPDDEVLVIYSGTNTSDSSLSSLSHQEEDELELKILNKIMQKGVGLIVGAGFGDDIGSAFSEGFKDILEDPVGDLIGYSRQGPCNGPVFSDARRFTGAELDNLNVEPLASDSGPYRHPGVRFTNHYTDEATHDSDVCGNVAETDVTFSIFRLPYVSVKDLMGRRFGGRTSLRSIRETETAFSVKQALGVSPP
jgi:hypothetical protein